MRILLTSIVICFVAFCGGLVIESGLFQSYPKTGQHCIVLQSAAADLRASGELQDTVNVLTSQDEPNEPDKYIAPSSTGGPASRLTRRPAELSAVGGPTETIILGAKVPKTEDHETGYKLQLELSSVGAAIRKATFSSGLHNGRPSGFNDRNYKDPQPLALLSPIKYHDGRELLSMANMELVLVKQNRQFALDRLSWQCLGIETAPDGSETAAFAVVIKDDDDGPILKLTKTYKVSIGSYMTECKLTVENLSDTEQEAKFGLSGPVGIGREAFRSDLRNVIGGFLTDDGQIVSSRKDMLVGFPMNLFSGSVGLKDTTRQYQKALQLRDQAQIREAKQNLQIGRNLPSAQRQARFLWAATANKYFAAIVRPVPDVEDSLERKGKDYCEWVAEKTAWFYNPDRDERGNSGDETIGLDLKVADATFAAAGQLSASKTYGFQLYIGPKDRDLFYRDELYKQLGFGQTITFMPCCCCPASIIRPLAFGILVLMKWMYVFIGNYGIVIIILVFLMRLVMHPVTKKSQVSMSKMSKLAPRTEEIKKKSANNKAEMNKQLMQLYKKQGASPIMGMLPMMVQMPIWIALWSAVNASVNLRGAAFLPFWITDLSLPDALIRFSTITIPLLGWKIESLNLLPILMGVAFYLQQKLMPSQAAASASPQMAQQQKMMMIMFPILFPLMLYKLPSGVNLYIMTSTFAGVIEQHVIRKHIRKKEEDESKGLVAATSKTGGKVKKKKPKPFFRF